MDYKQKYQKYKQKYLNLLKSQKGGSPFLMDILVGPVFSYLFERNQRLLKLIYTNKQPVMMQPLGNFTLNHRYRLNLISRSGLSILLATRLVQCEIRNRLELHLANRIISRTHKLPEIVITLTLDSSNGGHIDSVQSVACHPTAPLFVTCSDDNTAKLWLLNNPNGSAATCVATLDRSKGGHSMSVESVAFHPTLPFLATGSSDTTAKLWYLSHNLSKATCVATLNNHGIDLNSNPDTIWSVAFHPNELLLAIGCGNSIVKLWSFSPDGSINNCVATLVEHRAVVFSVAFHPTLPILATGSRDETVKLWRLDNPNGSAAICVATLNSSNGGHNDFVMSVAFHPTFPLLATGSDDNTAKLWRLDNPDNLTATCVATLDSSNGGHSSGVNSVAFHPTAPLLATGSQDRTVKLWRLDNPDGSAATCVATLDSSNGGHRFSVQSVAFHPNLPFLVSGSQDNTAKLWKL